MATQRQVKVTACVVSWNTAAHLPGVLSSLGAQTHPDLEIVVVDNASADGSAAIARCHTDVRVVANAANRGFAGAANQGVALARANGSDAFLVCNPDVVLGRDYVELAVKALGDGERRASVQGKLWRTGLGEAGAPAPAAGGDRRGEAAAPAPAAGGDRRGEADGRRMLDTTGHIAFATRLFRNRGEGTVDVGQFDEPGPVFGVCGCAALYRLDALEDVAVQGEVFDEDLFAFWEDVDLDWRLALRGFHAWYVPDACGWHERGGAGPRRTAVVERLNFTNRFLVVLKNDDAPALLRALPGVTVTSALKAGELALTVPSAFLRSAGAARLVPRMLSKRRLIHARATVDPADVVKRWFAPFDYQAWIATWWRRVGGQTAHRLPGLVSGGSRGSSGRPAT